MCNINIYYIFVGKVINAWKVIISEGFGRLPVFFLTEKGIWYLCLWVDGWDTHLVLGKLQLVFGVGVCFLQFESQQTEKKDTSRATKDLNLRALALVCNRKLQKNIIEKFRKNVLKLRKRISGAEEIYYNLFILTFRTGFT